MVATSLDIESLAVTVDGSTYAIDLSRPDASELAAAIRTFLRTHPDADTQDGPRRWVRELTEELDPRLTQLVAADPAITGTDPAVVADQLLAAVPTRHDLDRLTGPFYDTAGLTRWLGVTRQALDARVTKGSLLMCPLLDGTRVYPAWQFRPNKTTVPRLSELLKILRTGARSPWTVATWLRTPLDELENLDAVEWLDAGKDPTPVLAAAREDADRWAH